MKPSKYNAKKTEYDGITFDSKKEASRYRNLIILQHGGHISELKLQVKFYFVLNDVKMGFYRADFVYIENGARIVEDVKGFKTAMYNLKKKMMKAFHNIEIRET